MYKSRRSSIRVQNAPAEDVQIPRSPDLYTPAIEEEQLVRRLKIGEFRKGMKGALNGKQALVLGNYWRPRAIILPVGSQWLYGDAGRAARKRNLLRLFEAALKHLEM
jgi:hypothetical protein